MSCSVGSWLCALGVPVVYVLSIHIVDDGVRHRNHPSSITRRIIAVSSATVLIVFMTMLTLDVPLAEQLPLLGVHLDVRSMLSSSIYAAALVVTLFAGPLCVALAEEYDTLRACKGVTQYTRLWIRSTKESMHDLRFIRNIFVAPLTEEMCFRACIIALLSPCLPYTWLIAVSPLLFSLAHVHHAVQLIRHGTPIGRVVISTAFQMLYTFAFGVFASYMFVHTGHLAAAIVSHVVCNAFGFPDVAAVAHEPKVRRRAMFAAAYLTGLLAFIVHLFVL